MSEEEKQTKTPENALKETAAETTDVATRPSAEETVRAEQSNEGSSSDSVMQNVVSENSAQAESVVSTESVVSENFAKTESVVSENSAQTENVETEGSLPSESEIFSEEEAVLAGFSEERDVYGREILDRTFPNLLSLSVNSVKIDYSRLKNAILSYRGLRCSFDGESELFKRGKDAFARFKIENGKLTLTLAIPSGSIDKKVYPHKKAGKNESEKSLETVVSVANRAARERAVELLSLVAGLLKCEKNDSAAMVAYAERFPVNRNAVLRGEEEVPPEENRFDSEEYEDITGGVLREIEEAKGIVRKKSRPKKAKEELQDRRQTAKSVKGALALSEPVVYYYDVAVDKEDKPLFINVRQVLNDKFLGKLLPEQFFAVAEGSERIEQFNFLSVEAAASDAERYPEYVFVVQTSVRLLLKAETRKKLMKVISAAAGNLALSLDCALLEAAGETAAAAVKELRSAGAKILLDNSEQAGMRALTDFDYEFLRFDARYYRDGSKKSEAHLATLAGFAKTLGIASVASNVETVKEAVSFLTKGVGGVEGFIVEEPKRIVQSALKERKKLPAIRA